MIEFKDIKFDCRYFRGDIPCKPHKNYNVHCKENDGSDCEYYEKAGYKILIIKLGATGDVIRTTPILTRLKKEHPDARVYWLTLSPEVIPASVDEVLQPTADVLIYLQSIEFDLSINLDKDKEACALLNNINSKVKKGFILKDGKPYPADKDAEHKYLTGIFDTLSKVNTRNYMDEVFEVCGFDYNGEKYILDSFDEYKNDWELDRSKKIIGLNTGCGGRWTSRLWPNEYWIELINNLIDKGCEVVLLGGKIEDERNKYLSENTGAVYFGYFHLQKFINLMNQCDLVVTGVTMAMHITLALKKKIVLFNNIFNKHEFELFGLGEIIEPTKECKCFYQPRCTNDEYQCMNFIKPVKVLDTIQKFLGI
ncbi:MAG: glycosyltransferase family 9 protein [Ignavibacteria bacterium]|jgi:heptosyltransferase-2